MRGVKGLVIVMAVLIFVGIIAVVWAIVNIEKPASKSDAAQIAKIAETLSLGLPAGCEIAGMELDGRRLAVRTAGSVGAADCARIYVVDLSSGDVITTVAP